MGQFNKVNNMYIVIRGITRDEKNLIPPLMHLNDKDILSTLPINTALLHLPSEYMLGHVIYIRRKLEFLESSKIAFLTCSALQLQY